jgi:hypothetical protein
MTYYDTSGFASTGYAWYSIITENINAGMTSSMGASSVAEKLLAQGFTPIVWAELPEMVASRVNVLPIFLPVFMFNMIEDPYQILGYKETLT